MGKKHKKHHKSEKRERDEEEDYQEKQSEKHDKPLKMVIKIGSGETAEQTSVSEDRPHEEKKHKHKKKKKKKEKDKDKERHKHHHHEHKRHHESHSETKYQESTKETTESEIDVEDGEPPAKRALLQSHDQASREAAEMYERKLREPRSCTLNKSEDPLKPLLEYLQRFLMRKDVNGFFAFPVNDIIAPGYSSIISHPMDLSTMQAKIDREEYQTAAEYKADFMLMLDNAMTYNRPDTIYYKAAKKLQGMGMKMMSKERLLNMKRTLPFMQNITLEQLGIEDDPADTEPKKPKKVQVKSSAIVHEATPDNLTPKEILAQAQAAAKDAGDKLSLRRPDSKIGFLRRQKDGTTTLNVLNPDNDGIVSETERVITIGVSETERVITIGGLVGKLSQGTGAISGFKEDKRNVVKPVNYLSYAPFSSFAPSYDSSFANLSKEDSDLLLSTYGCETGVQYANSLKDFVENCGTQTVTLVDSLLNYLTGGEHAKAQKMLLKKKEEEEKKKQEEKLNKDEGQKVTDKGVDGDKPNEEKMETDSEETKSSDPEINFKELKSLESELGIDMSFLDNFEKQSKEKQVQKELNTAADLIKNLRDSQEERLRQKPPAHLAHIQGPSAKEMTLAGQVTDQLTKLTKQVTPGEVVSTDAVRSAMGISIPNPGDQSDGAGDNEDAQSQAVSHLSHDDTPADLDNELQAFLDQGPSLRVCDSPSGNESPSVSDAEGK